MNTAKNITDALYRRGVSVPRVKVQEAIDAISTDGTITQEQRDAIILGFMTPDAGGDVSQAPRLIEPKEMIPYTPLNSGISQMQSTEIVMNQVEVLNLDLKASEVRAISTELYQQNLSGGDAIIYCTELLKDYITQDEKSYENVLRASVNSVVSHVNNSYQRRNTMTTEAFAAMAREVKDSTNNYKSSCTAFTTELQNSFKSPRA